MLKVMRMREVEVVIGAECDGYQRWSSVSLVTRVSLLSVGSIDFLGAYGGGRYLHKWRHRCYKSC